MSKSRDDVGSSKIRILGLNPEVCGMVGSQKYLNQVGGLNYKHLEDLLAS